LNDRVTFDLEICRSNKQVYEIDQSRSFDLEICGTLELELSIDQELNVELSL